MLNIALLHSNYTTTTATATIVLALNLLALLPLLDHHFQVPRQDIRLGVFKEVLERQIRMRAKETEGVLL